jgi:glyoxylase-like metal-dependent hydrolase (beta-lactamase superfamily II)
LLRRAFSKARFVRLREYLEHCPVSCNDDEPLNPGGARQYTIICTHCHYDHIGGISQFLLGGTTDIIASAAGRDFIESDLEENGLFRYVDKVTPWYQVTHWAQAFEKLVFPVPRRGEKSTNASKLEVIDLAITLIQQPGHTPDSLAWYDHDEMHLYVGDSVYEEGEEEMRIIWPPQGNMIEWTFSMQKLRQFVRSENAQVSKVGRGWCF